MKSAGRAFSVLALMGAFVAGTGSQLTHRLVDGQDPAGETAALVLAVPCAVLVYFGCRVAGVVISPGPILASYWLTTVLAAAMVLSFAVPQWLFQNTGLSDFLVSSAVAVVIGSIAGLGLSRFYRSSTPEGPEDLSP